MSRRIVITGGATGIGLAIAKQLASCSCDLILLSRNEERLSGVAQQLEEDYAVSVSYYACHMRDESALAQTIDAMNAEHDVGGLINNAAANFICPTENISMNGFHAIFDTVAVGTFMLSKMFGEHWIKTGKTGSILSISASYASGAGPYVVPSAMGKAAIEAMTRSLAVEWADRGIKVNAISPGLFPTPGSVKQLLPSAAMVDQVKKYIPRGEFGQLSEIAQLAQFLLVDSGSYLTGEVIRLDGGFYHASGAGPFFDLLKNLSPEAWQLLRKKT